MSVQSGPNGIESGLVLYLDAGNRKSYPGTGATFYDIGSNNHTTLVGSPAFSNSNNGYLTFDGSTNYGTVANNPVGAAYSKMVWFYCTNFSPSNNLLSSDTGGHIFWLAGSNKLTGAHTNTSFTLIQSVTNLSLNTWYCGAVTFNTTTGWALYLNGELESTNATVSPRPGNGAVSLSAYAGGNFFAGRIALAQIYNRAISAAEIRQLFNATRGRFGI
tara:strand:- start:323 stop:973 length:651 start_codon:yes stop_codon:yes gene_type:complete